MYGGREDLNFQLGESKRGFRPLFTNFFFPLIKGKGIKGIGLATYRHSGVYMLLLALEVKAMGTRLKRTTIFLTEEQHERLRRLAFEQRTSMAKLLRDAALEILEDEEDIREGLKALADEEGTITWEQYQRQRAVREPRDELSG